MFANIYLSEVPHDASEQHHPLQENTTHRQTSEKQPISCEVCGKAFSTPGWLKKHIQKHAEGCECEFCGQRFTQKFRLKQHRRKHAENDPKQSIAFMPTAVLVIEKEMRQNMIKETMKKKDGQQCERCGKFFTSAGSLKRHIRDFAEIERCKQRG